MPQNALKNRRDLAIRPVVMNRETTDGVVERVSGDEQKRRLMTIKLVALVLLCLMIGTALAQEPKVTSLMSKDLPENPGREALMITVEHAHHDHVQRPLEHCAAAAGLFSSTAG